MGRIWEAERDREAPSSPWEREKRERGRGMRNGSIEGRPRAFRMNEWRERPRTVRRDHWRQCHGVRSTVMRQFSVFTPVQAAAVVFSSNAPSCQEEAVGGTLRRLNSSSLSLPLRSVLTPTSLLSLLLLFALSLLPLPLLSYFCLNLSFPSLSCPCLSSPLTLSPFPLFFSSSHFFLLYLLSPSYLSFPPFHLLSFTFSLLLTSPLFSFPCPFPLSSPLLTSPPVLTSPSFPLFLVLSFPLPSFPFFSSPLLSSVLSSPNLFSLPLPSSPLLCQWDKDELLRPQRTPQSLVMSLIKM